METLAPEIQHAVSIAKEEVEELLASTQWRFFSSKNGVETWTMPSASGITMLRACTVIDASPDDILALLANQERKQELDPMVKETQILYEIPEDSMILRQVFKTPWPTTDREFVFVVKTFKEGKRILVVAKSVDLATPPTSGVVRGEVLASCYLLESQSDGVKVTFLAHVDPKGSIPRFLVNYATKKQSQGLHRLRVALKVK